MFFKLNTFHSYEYYTTLPCFRIPFFSSFTTYTHLFCTIKEVIQNDVVQDNLCSHLKSNDLSCVLVLTKTHVQFWWKGIATNLINVPISEQADSQSPFVSSWKVHILPQVHCLERLLLQQLYIQRPFSLTCLYTSKKSAQNFPCSCIPNHEPPLMQPLMMLNLLKVWIKI